MNEKTNFPATYFERDSILRLARLADIVAWIILIYHVAQFLLSVLIYILQITRGQIFVAGFTDLTQQILWFIQPNFQGLWYFIAIQAIGKLLLIFMDIEDNLRRIARK